MPASINTEQLTDLLAGPYQVAVDQLVSEYPDVESLRLDWTDIDTHDAELAQQALTEPERFRDETVDVLADRDRQLREATVRIYNIPNGREFRMGKYRKRYLSELIRVEGEVVSVDNVQPFAREAAFRCRRCGKITKVTQHYGKLMKPVECGGPMEKPEGECDETKSGSFIYQQAESDLVDYQPIVIIPPDTSMDDPPATQVYLKGDLCGTVGKGDRISVVGIYETFTFQDDSRLNTYIEAVDIQQAEAGDTEADAMEMSELKDAILTFVDEHKAEGEPPSADVWGVNKADLKDEFASRGVRREETEEAITQLKDAVELHTNGPRLFT